MFSLPLTQKVVSQCQSQQSSALGSLSQKRHRNVQSHSDGSRCPRERRPSRDPGLCIPRFLLTTAQASPGGSAGLYRRPPGLCWQPHVPRRKATYLFCVTRGVCCYYSDSFISAPCEQFYRQESSPSAPFRPLLVPSVVHSGRPGASLSSCPSAPAHV